MKVQAIQGFNYNSYKNINQKNLKEISNPIDTETKSVSAEQALAQISFKATPTELANRIKKAPIADKLAVGLSLVPLGGVLVLAKNIEMFTNALQDFVRCTMPEALSYVSFLKDERMKQAFLFINDNEDESKICLYNPNEEDIESWRKVESGEMLELEYNDGGITVDGQWVPLQRKAMTFKNLDAYMDYFITERDLTGELFEWAHEHNNKIIEEIPEFFEDAEISEADETSKTTVAEGVLEGEQTKEVKATEKTEKKKKKISFADVGGLDDVVKSLKRNLLYPMKYPEVFKDLMTCRGAVLYGPPGTGKTFLAEAFVAEAGASAFTLSATEFAAKYVGESEKNVRDLFQKAVDAQPSVIYLDEFDALGKSRGGADVHNDKLLNQFLASMSELEKRGDNVVILASTNRLEDLDPAIVRSGRFDLKLEVKAPDLQGTEKIFDLKTKGKPLDEALDRTKIIKKMYERGMTGADITATVRNAYVNALERNDIYKSMDEDRFSELMMEHFSINEDDFMKAIDAFNAKKAERRKIGY